MPASISNISIPLSSPLVVSERVSEKSTNQSCTSTAMLFVIRSECIQLCVTSWSGKSATTISTEFTSLISVSFELAVKEIVHETTSTVSSGAAILLE